MKLGVGASSAMSFRFDLKGLRLVLFQRHIVRGLTAGAVKG